MTLKSLVIGLIFQVIALPTVSGEVRPVSEYWKKTPLKYKSDIRMSFRIQACMSSETEFVGCVFGIQSLLAHAQEEPLTVVPDHLLLQHKFDFEKTVENFYGFKAVKTKDWAIPEEGLTPFQRFLKFQERSKEEVNIWIKLYKALRQNELAIDFSKILDWVEVQISPALKENEQPIVAAALNQYLGYVFDPHTRLVPLQYMTDKQNSSTQSFVGVGIMIQTHQDKLIVSETILDGPAFHAGIKAGDVILSVDDKKVGSDVTPSEAPNFIRGSEGTSVTLKIQRKLQALVFKIKRARVVSKNVEYKVLRNNKKNVGYIKLRSFMPTSGCKDVEKALDSFKSKRLSGIILDLRGNSGGLLEQGICITDLFIPKGKKVLISKGLRKGEKTTTFYSKKPQKTNLPLVTLINAASASASEIVAGALQDHKRSLTVGVRSYGKGTMQAPTGGFFTGPQRILLFATIARFYLPSGRTNQVFGITPDVEVFTQPNPTLEQKTFLREEDLHLNPLASIGTPWVQTRPQYIQAIKECMQASGRANEAFEKDRAHEAIIPDFQKLTALDTVNCMLN